MTRTEHPYEFLVRWDESTGALRGYHFKTITRHYDGDQLIAAKESVAMNAAAAQAAGFPIGTILDALNVDALKRVDELTAELAARDATLSEMESALRAAIAEVRANAARVA